MIDSTLHLLWLIAGIILMALELILPGGIVFFLGVGAVVVALLLFVGLIVGWVQAFTAWFVASLLLVFGLRGVVQKIIPARVDRSNTDTDLDALNAEAEVVDAIPANGEGRIRFNGSTWPAANAHHDKELSSGTTVRIVSRDNLIWIVEALDHSA